MTAADCPPSKKTCVIVIGGCLTLINEPAFRDGNFFALNPANNQNPKFGQVGPEPAGGHWLYAFLRFDPVSRQRFLVLVNLHPKAELTGNRILFSPEAIGFLDVAPDEKRFTGKERLEGNLELVINVASLSGLDGLVLPALPPLSAYFFEITPAPY